jgi:hypothetical protein
MHCCACKRGPDSDGRGGDGVGAAASRAAPADQAAKICDTFVALPPHAPPGAAVFAKNSDRPSAEMHEVVLFPPAEHAPGAAVRRTYISVPQARRTLDVLLSRPSWMFGAETAANEAEFVVGNEAVWTTEPDDGPPALPGMDLVRLAAERGATAAAAVDVLTTLLEALGQGRGCAEGDDWSYRNSFMVADAGEAWVVEMASRRWAAERVAGLRNVSNCLSVRRWACGAEGLGAACAARGAPARAFAAAFAEGGAPPARRAPGARTRARRCWRPRPPRRRARSASEPWRQFSGTRARASACAAAGAFGRMAR